MPRLRPPRPRRPLTLFERALLAGTGLLALILVLLVVTPVTVSAPIRIGELAILVVAFFALLALNAVYVRRALAPLSRLSEKLRGVDLADPEPLEIEPADRTPELAAFTDSFNEMLDRLRAERQARSRAALLAQERERRRIAQALHDEAGQTLTAVALEIEREAAAAPEGEERARLEALARELHGTLDEIRRVARELRPEALDDLGLVNALIALSSRVERQGGIEIERRLTGELPPLPEAVELVVYRVAQEALTNVLRHSGARRCRIELSAAGAGLRLRVADDGAGLPAELPGGTLGLEGMRERALLAGGRLALGLGLGGGGASVTLEIPLEGA